MGKRKKCEFAKSDMHHRSKLTDHEVETIRQLRESGMPIGLIALKFDLHRVHVWRLVNYQRRQR